MQRQTELGSAIELNNIEYIFGVVNCTAWRDRSARLRPVGVCPAAVLQPTTPHLRQSGLEKVHAILHPPGDLAAKT